MTKHASIVRSFLLSTLACLLAAPLAEAAGYLGPASVLVSKDGKALYVANLDAKQIAVVDPAAGKVVKTVAVPAEPAGMALSPDGATLYVTCAAPKSTVAVVDIAGGKIAASISVGHTATGLAVSPDGKRAWVCNRFNNDVSVIDLEAKKEIARVPATREPHGAAVTPDGKTVFVINHLAIDRADGYDVAALITVIDAATNKPTSIRLPNGSSSLRGLCISPDGKYLYVTHLLSRYQMPTTQLERGWMNTNAMTIVDAAEKKIVNTVLLDNVDLGAANPWGVATTADGKSICVAQFGARELSIIDAQGMMDKLAALAAPKTEKKDSGLYASTTPADVPNDLSFLVGVRKRMPLPGVGPQGVAVFESTAYVTEYFSDALCAVDIAAKPANPAQPVRQIALGPKPELTKQRRGEILFNDATICFQRWQSCGSCHPDSRADALNWDLMNDGLGNPKNTKSMLLAHQTPPSMSEAARGGADEAVRSGIKHILFAVRPEEDAEAIDEYLKSLKPVPSPYLVDGKLSPAAERGKKIFFDEAVGCARCHPEPHYTDLKMHNVNSRGQYDRRSEFDTPALSECWRTAPYMHDGQYTTMKELFLKGKHGGKDVLDKLTPQQIDDLVEFVLSL
jgi:YVTN family beta-propeller protein